MVDKRLRKLKAMNKEALPATLKGSPDCRYLVVGWGSTRTVVEEALDVLNRKDISFLHFSQVYPLHQGSLDLIRRARKRIVIENNATAQFGKLIRSATGIDFEEKILKYDGMPFMLEDVMERIDDLTVEAQ
jgi:2-oxoglutarate ferredoxin oxidoreductase subunit alpha